MNQNQGSARNTGSPRWTEKGDRDATMGTVTRTYQKGAKENEGDEVEVGKVASTLGGVGVLVTSPVAETRQHDLVPRLPSGTPEKKGGAMRPTRAARLWPAHAGEWGQGGPLLWVPPTEKLQRVRSG